MPGSSPVGSSVSRRVSGGVAASTFSHGAFVVRWAVQGGGASPRAVESTSAVGRVAPLPASAESTTRAGVTSITLLGGASSSAATRQPMTSARPAREASLPWSVRIECPLASAHSVLGGLRLSCSDALRRRHAIDSAARGASPTLRSYRPLNHSNRYANRGPVFPSYASCAISSVNGSAYRAIRNGPASTGSNPTSLIS